ncbi:MAG: Fe-S cluster assembly protein SufD [Alcanivoracaceae bacterium]|nr:Fe-S cluster assembly protein SufD [Alcanivoracaceae bacterium]
MTLTESLKAQALEGATAYQQRNDTLSSLRDAGRDALENLPFPDKKSERWKYTSLIKLQDGHLAKQAHKTSELSTADVPDFGGAQLVITNGALPATLPKIDGVIFSTLSADNPSAAKELTPFSGFNAATLQDGLNIHVAKGAQVKQALHIIYVGESDTPASAATRVNVTLDENSAFTLIEHYAGTGPALTSAITRIHVGGNAELTHYRLQSESAETLHISELDIQQQRDSRVRSYQLMKGNVLRRNDVRVWMNEPGADLVIRAVFLARDSSHVDNNVCIEHASPHCTSDQIFKGIAGETGKAVFNGRIHIHPGAKGTDAQLSNKNLLLANTAEIDSKPELEIYNDDVKCGHGTTIGQMDSEQLFYLRSRGVDAEQAKRMLGIGFINELILSLPNEAIAEWARDWLGESL